MGVYGKNRPEWVLTDLASATLGGTTIAFYDTLGPQAIELVNFNCLWRPKSQSNHHVEELRKSR